MFFFFRTAMLHALSHSRPPSYRSHVSDHPVIESSATPVGAPGTHTTTSPVTQPLSNNTATTSSSTINNNNNNQNTTQSTTTITNRNREQVQVAEVHAVPPGSPESSSSVGLNRSPVSSAVISNQRSPMLSSGNHSSMISREILSHTQSNGGPGQDVSIVPVVSSRHHRNDSVVFEGKTDLAEQYQYHIKSGNGNNPENNSSSALKTDDLYNHLFSSTHQENQEKRSVVTIVQTSATNSEPVIVTVSGSLEQRLNTTSSDSGSDFSEIRASPAEVEILATL